MAPEIIAHRGFTRLHAENTLLAFAAALDEGADAVELDVHATADGVVVVHHDAWLKATTDAPRVAVGALTWQELRQITGSAAVPTLVEVLERVAGRAKVYVEIKAPHIEHRVCALVAPCRDWCAIHSFDHRVIANAREIAPSIPRGVLMTSYLLDPLLPLQNTASRDLWQHWELIDEALVAAVHRAGARAIAWTVNSVDDARRLVRWGVDGICTDEVDVMGRLLRPVEPRSTRDQDRPPSP